MKLDDAPEPDETSAQPEVEREMCLWTIFKYFGD
jgi:hypothetical protein